MFKFTSVMFEALNFCTYTLAAVVLPLLEVLVEILFYNGG